MDNGIVSTNTSPPDQTLLNPATDDPSKPSNDRVKLALKSIIDDFIASDVDREKIYQYAQARKNELYFRGNQYVYPILLGGSVVDYTSTGSLQYNQTPEELDTEYDYVMNVIRGDGMKFIAVLGQRGPNVKAQPRRPDDEAAVRRARKADLAASYLRSIWTPEKIQRQLAMSLWKNGTTFAYTPWVANGEKYGQTREVQLDFQNVPLGSPYYVCTFCGNETPQANAGQPPACSSPACGQPFQPTDLKQAPVLALPVAVGEKFYPRGTVECYLATIFEVTLPFYIKDLSEAPWLWYEYEEYKGKLLAAFPQLRQTMKDDEWGGDNSGVGAQGQLARDIASSPTGSYITPRMNRWLYQRFWLRPAMFTMMADQTLGNQLATLYPQGCKVAMVNGEIVDVQAERLDDVWSMCKPSLSEYIFADPVCYDYLPIQDLINDLYNITAETLERAIPYVLADPMVLDVVQMSKQRGKPGQIVPAKAGVGKRLQDSVFRAPVATVEPQTINWMSTIREQGRELVGVLPAIFGGEGPMETARQAEMQRNQALQQLNPVWNEMREFWAQTYLNGVRQLARHSLPDGTNLGQSDGGMFEDGEADFTDLLGGGWFYETDEAMPMTWGQKTDKIMFMLQQAPQIGDMMGINHPLNVAKIQEVMGIADWKVTNVDKRDKVLSLIQQLKQGQPIPDPAGGPPQPSIPPDVFEDDHMFSASVVKEWAQTEEARALRDRNPAGYANVMAWAQAHLQLSGPPPMPPGPPGVGPGPAPGPPGPGGAPMPGAPPPGMAGPPGLETPPAGGTVGPGPAGPGPQ